MVVSSSEATSTIIVVVDSVTNRVLIPETAQGSHGSVTNRTVAVRDANRVPVMIGTSSADDGVLVMPVVESGNLRFNTD